MARFIQTVAFLAAQAMIVLRVGDPPAAVIAAVARIIQTVALLPAQTLIVIRVGDPPATVVTTMARFITTIRIVAAQAMVVLGVGDRARGRHRHDAAIYRDDPKFLCPLKRWSCSGSVTRPRPSSPRRRDL